MKNILTTLVGTVAIGISIFFAPKANAAQVDVNLLVEIAGSCQKDVFDSKYYDRLGHTNEFNPDNFSETGLDNLLGKCITSRYLYTQILSQFPWLASTGEMMPGYAGSVAVSLLVDNNYGVGDPNFSSGIVDCLVTQDSESGECYRSHNLKGLYTGSIDSVNELNVFNYDSSYAYLCSSCYVAYNKNPSGTKVVGAFMEWFTNLELSQRRELMSVLGDEESPRINRMTLNQEAERAWSEYEEIRQQIAQEDKEQKRRDLLGQ